MFTAERIKLTSGAILLLALLAGFGALNNYQYKGVTGAAVISDECAFDLSDYPCMFSTSDGRFDGVIVVGDQASSEDVAGWVDIAQGLNNYLDAPQGTKLASEITSQNPQNIISVGAACANAITAKLLGNPADCRAGLTEGTAKIQLIRQANGKAAVVIMGYSAADTKRAAKVLRSYRDWQAAGLLKGQGIIVKQLNSGGGTKILAWDPSRQCTDSDGGKNSNVKGVGKGIYQSSTDHVIYGTEPDPWAGKLAPSDATYSIFNDYCRNPDELSEAYCDSSGLQSFSITCPNGCQDGACLATPQSSSSDYNGALYECHDGAKGTIGARLAGDRNGPCHSEELIRSEANRLCSNKCKTESGVTKCGVNSLSYTPCNSTSQGAQVNVVVANGWNLISANLSIKAIDEIILAVDDGLFCRRGNFSDTLWYLKPDNTYDPAYMLGQDFKFPQIGVHRSFPAVWLYNYGPQCTLSGTLPPVTEGLTFGTTNIPEFLGVVHMLGVPKEWSGRKLSDMLGTCQFRGMWKFYPERSMEWADKWESDYGNNYIPTTVFSQSEVGRGVFLYLYPPEGQSACKMAK